MNTSFQLNLKKGYFQNQGVDVMAFDDIYPEGHQSGVSLLMHGHRLATNGDIRFEPTPGQWQPVPKQLSRSMDEKTNTITTTLCYPDLEKHLNGKYTNPMLYPDFQFQYTVTVQGAQEGIHVTVDLDRPVSPEFAGKLCFNLELFPGSLFDQPWIMDDQQGIFPRQPNGPTLSQPSLFEKSGHIESDNIRTTKERLSGPLDEYSPLIADDLIAEPYAVGRHFTVCPQDPLSRFTVESKGTELRFFDGRMNHNNGWFVLSAVIPSDQTEKVVDWWIYPNVVDGWQYEPVVQTSQVGYHPAQPKIAFIELDSANADTLPAEVVRLGARGPEKVTEIQPETWGNFLRYRYLKADFTVLRQPGLYQIRYGKSVSSIFRIAEDVYDRGVWQPVLEYFLPVQMCHMKVNEKYRVWHDLCHNDDATMAPTNFHHFDGYSQGPSTLTRFQSGEHVPGLNQGGWHDAGDFDLRVESQAGESYILALAYEEFNVNYDATSIDQNKKLVEIHQPDGKNDILQQVEHGMLSVVGAYDVLGRLYRGIICRNLRQYVLLGDGSSMTDGIPGNEDDRWVFTEDNPSRELTSAAQIAASARVLRDFNPDLSARCLHAAQELYSVTKMDPNSDPVRRARIHAACELFLTTGDSLYRQDILAEKDFILAQIVPLGWIVARVVHRLQCEDFQTAFAQAMVNLKAHYDKLSAETPYGIPYRPHIWGAGWDIQKQGFQYYFLLKAYPEIFSADFVYNALNFVLGCHPGSNTASFASGIGTKSATVGYGFNRADWTYIPGGVISGTALIRPDFPELLTFPFLWQQTEYVLGGGSSHYMFLVLAAQKLVKDH